MDLKKTKEDLIGDVLELFNLWGFWREAKSFNLNARTAGDERKVVTAAERLQSKFQETLQFLEREKKSTQSSTPRAPDIIPRALPETSKPCLLEPRKVTQVGNNSIPSSIPVNTANEPTAPELGTGSTSTRAPRASSTVPYAPDENVITQSLEPQKSNEVLFSSEPNSNVIVNANEPAAPELGTGNNSKHTFRKR